MFSAENIEHNKLKTEYIDVSLNMRCESFLSSFRVLRSKLINNFFSLSFKNLSTTKEYHQYIYTYLSILIIFNKNFSRLLHPSSVSKLKEYNKKQVHKPTTKHIKIMLTYHVSRFHAS